MRTKSFPLTGDPDEHEREAFESRLRMQLESWSVAIREAAQRQQNGTEARSGSRQIFALRRTLAEARIILTRFEALDAARWKLEKGGMVQLWEQLRASVDQALRSAESDEDPA